MKRIVHTIPDPQEVILASKLPENPTIGTCTRQGLQVKGFIQKTDPRDEESYQITLAYSLTEGGRYNPSLFGGTLEKALSHPDLDYFLFDSYALLYQWLAQ
jgi:hypothetical protein